MVIVAKLFFLLPDSKGRNKIHPALGQEDVTGTMTVRAAGRERSVPATVLAYTAKQMEVEGTIPETIEGLNPDLTGINLRIVRDDDAEETVPLTLEMLEGYRSDLLGNQTVTVRFAGQTTTVNVSVRAKKANQIAIKEGTVWNDVVLGEELDLSGKYLTVTYDNGTTEEIAITAEMLSGFDSDQSGTQTVTITYQDKTATFSVNVVEASSGNGCNGCNGSSAAQLLAVLMLFAGAGVFFKR